MSANPWYTKVNASALSDEARRLISERVEKKLGLEKTLRELGIARGSLHNYLHGLRTVPDSMVYKARQYLGARVQRDSSKG
jgi:transcriptional regulator with XRE-family HTH domain